MSHARSKNRHHQATREAHSRRSPGHAKGHRELECVRSRLVEGEGVAIVTQSTERADAQPDVAWARRRPDGRGAADLLGRDEGGGDHDRTEVARQERDWDKVGPVEHERGRMGCEGPDGTHGAHARRGGGVVVCVPGGGGPSDTRGQLFESADLCVFARIRRWQWRWRRRRRRRRWRRWRRRRRWGGRRDERRRRGRRRWG